MELDQVRREAETPMLAVRETVDAVAADLSAAFFDEPVMSWFMRTDARRDAARARFFRVILSEVALPDGQIERPASGGAAAVWIPSERLGPMPLSREVRALPMLLNAAGLARFNRLLKLRTVMDRHHPTDRAHDYLWFLGVRPQAQGQGLGSRLLKSRTARLDAAARPGFLETATPRNVALYQRHGFRIVSEYRPADDGPLIWAMWREPGAS